MDEYKVIVMLVVMLCWVINCRLKVGRCENGDCSGDGKCICKNGFSGTTCDTKKDPCAQNPCGTFQQGTCTANLLSTWSPEDQTKLKPGMSIFQYTCACK
jgi:hypothetical protein